MDHNERDCDKELELKSENGEASKLYGLSLRAKTYIPVKVYGPVKSSRSNSVVESTSSSGDERTSRFLHGLMMR